MKVNADPARGPAATYRALIEAHASEVRRTHAQDGRFGTGRLLLFTVVVAVGGLALAGAVHGAVVLLPLLAFLGVVLLHGRARNLRRGAERRLRLYERGLARIEDRWAGEGPTGEAFLPEGHLYGVDLDLVGTGSLFQLLSSARTRAGEATLAGWLLAPAAPAVVTSRQEAVAALAPRLDLREDFALSGDEVHAALDRHAAEAWVAAPRRLGGQAFPWIVRLLGLVTTALFAGWSFGGWPFLPFGVSAVIQIALTLPLRARVLQVLAEADRPVQDLALVARLIERFEEEPFQSGRLGELRRALEEDGVSASARIRSLVRLMDFVDARRNQIFLPLSGLLALGTQLAYALETWRADHGPKLGGWLDALGELEALLSLSAYAYEHPEDPFPELVEGRASFAGTALGHPLLPTAANVRNDVELVAQRDRVQALLVSGSNMSGKSTLLRTVGVNAVLALAGAPVRAAALRLSPLSIGASIRVQDSLQEGASRFYAEIQRLKGIVDLAGGPVPALFLLDEMLGGTNSHDRRIGAEAAIRTLLDRKGIGLLTTHDLALAEIAKRDPRLENVHFEDRLEDGRMRFDYRLHPGVVRHSNAIALMRAVGLDIEEQGIETGTGAEGGS